MPYMLKTTENESGRRTFVKQRKGKSFVYLVETDDHQKYIVDKNWILVHHQEIQNVGISGNAIYPVESKRNTPKQAPQAPQAPFSPTSKSSIQDFGEKIGGAKKELWASRGLNLADIQSFNELERDKFITKDNIWKKPNSDDLTQQGYSNLAIKYIDMLRKSISPKPIVTSDKTVSIAQEQYIEALTDFKNRAMQIKTADDIERFNTDTLVELGIIARNGAAFVLTDKGRTIYTKSLGKIINYDKNAVLAHAHSKSLFSIICLNEEKVTFNDSESYDLGITINGGTRYYYHTSKEKKPRQFYISNPYILVHDNKIVYAAETLEKVEKFQSEFDGVLSQLINPGKMTHEGKKKREGKKNIEKVETSSLDRIGPQIITRNITGQDFLNIFTIKGGEFGNWLNEDERQENLNKAFEAFKDLALVLGIADSSISIRKSLSIAFGARGSGSAVAHYEPMRQVINLTKLKGAGSLAHEYFHAIDNIAAKLVTGASSKNMTDRKGLSPAFRRLVEVMQYDSEKNDLTEYYTDSIILDSKYKKSGHDYYQSNKEMAARAFACYIKDKLQERGIVNPYLTAHAELPVLEQRIYTYPRGNERKRINSCFDEVIQELKRKGIF